MKKRIKRLSVLHTGKFMAAFYALLTVLMVPFILIGMSSGGDGTGFVMLFMLVLYPIMGFIGGIIMAAFYNLISGWIGGIEVTVEDVGDDLLYVVPEN